MGNPNDQTITLELNKRQLDLLTEAFTAGVALRPIATENESERIMAKLNGARIRYESGRKAKGLGHTQPKRRGRRA